MISRRGEGCREGRGWMDIAPVGRWTIFGGHHLIMFRIPNARPIKVKIYLKNNNNSKHSSTWSRCAWLSSNLKRPQKLRNTDTNTECNTNKIYYKNLQTNSALLPLTLFSHNLLLWSLKLILIIITKVINLFNNYQFNKLSNKKTTLLL